MSISASEVQSARAQNVALTKDTLRVTLSDGRTISVPLEWYPRLMYGTRRERGQWRLIGKGEGIHWPDLDEDISVEGLLAGRASAESRTSLERWRQGRAARKGK